MESSDNFEQYFLKLFKTSFSELLTISIKNILNVELKKKLNKIETLVESLDYKKIILEFSQNKDFRLLLSEYKKSNFTKNELIDVKNKKKWRIMPSFQIDDILQNVNNEIKLVVYKLCKQLFASAVSYSQVIESNEFIPQLGAENIASNFGINELIGTDKYETPDAFKFCIENIISKWTESDDSFKSSVDNLDKNINNLNNEQLSDAALNMQNLLQNEKETESTKFLSTMINSIKLELSNIKNSGDTTNSKDGMKKIYKIASNIQEQMLSNVNTDDINPLELWSTATSFAKKTTGSDKIDLIHNLVEEQIVAKMNENIEESIRKETEQYISSIN
jgi:hypothetical protein